jgi:hypothetical protein
MDNIIVPFQGCLGAAMSLGEEVLKLIVVVQKDARFEIFQSSPRAAGRRWQVAYFRSARFSGIYV